MKTERPSPRRTLALGHTIQRLSLPEALAESLQERILSGEFKDGDQLVQETIAQEYEVSRMPVREALRQLEARGLVTLKMHKGAVVTSLPADQIAELFDLRALLECDLLTLAVPRLKPAHIAETEALLDRLEAAYHTGEVSLWGELNWAFHRSLYLPAGRVQTLAIVQGINVQTDRYIRLQLTLSHSSANAESEHRELLRLCIAGEVKMAVAHLKQHILAAGRDLLAVLAQHAAHKAA